MDNDKIVNYAGYGRHIPLKCKNHPNKRWSTKNLLHIGARTIFYNLHSVEGMGPECMCLARDLVPLTEEEARREEKARRKEDARREGEVRKKKAD